MKQKYLVHDGAQVTRVEQPWTPAPTVQEFHIVCRGLANHPRLLRQFTHWGHTTIEKACERARAWGWVDVSTRAGREWFCPECAAWLGMGG